MITHFLLLFNIWPSWIVNLRSLQFVLLIAVFIIFSMMVYLGILSDFDNRVTLLFKSIHGNEKFDMLMIGFASLGDIFSLFIVAIILTIIRRTRKAGVVFLMALVIISISVMYLKNFIGRYSPMHLYKLTILLPKDFPVEEDSFAPFVRNYSYPSNHVASTTALAFIAGFSLVRRWKVTGLFIWSFPIINAFARLYLLQHYLSDIVGGFTWGLIISIFLANILRLDEPFLLSRFKGKEDISR